MRLLVINPNTTATITDLVAGHARRIVGDEAEIHAVTARFGEPYVGSRAAAAVAAHAALDAFEAHGQGFDAVLLACFGDPGLQAVKERSPVPVVGMAEASCHLASMLGRRFGIVTGGARWRPMLEDFVGELGLSSRLAGIRTVAPSGGEIAAEPERALALLEAGCRACIVEDGADIVILGGAGLAGLAGRIGPRLDRPVICSLQAGLQAILALGRLMQDQPGRTALDHP